jgi:chromate transporter
MEERAIEQATPAGLGEIAREFLRLGFVAFGGPPVHFAMMEERFVREKKWLSHERFLDLLGAVNLLPGPSSTELTIYLGDVRAGLAGLLVAGLCFILPSAVMVVGLAWAYEKFGKLTQVEGLLFGIKPVVVALILPALWNLGKVAEKCGLSYVGRRCDPAGGTGNERDHTADLCGRVLDARQRRAP